ncbi:methyltransferase [Bacteriovoracaceae bacterium]|nr:methyltransferase [Bacteriovoracaceae bacterium]
MDYRKQFNELIQYLVPYKKMWAKEVVFSYPNHIEPFPQEWISELLEKNDQQLWSIDNGETKYIEDQDLIKLFDGLDKIQSFPKIDVKPTVEKYPSWAFFRVKNKKKHEIQRIVDFISHNQSLDKTKKIIDIGGGQGHLARILSYYHGHDVTVIDQNQEFLELGIKRAKKYPAPDGAGVLTFKKHTFGESLKDDSKYCQETLTLGLHTCGPLAHRHFEQLIETDGQALLNFGCCYNRLDPEIDIPLSQFAKDLLSQNNIQLTKHSLTLATRGHKEKTFESFLLKKRVKEYRCALHIYMYQFHSQLEFIGVGSEHPRVYEGNFEVYAQKKLNEIKIDVSLSELKSFYESEKIQKTIKEMFRANIIRWQFGRALEKWILLDRAIYLEENGLNTEIFPLFDPELSPRNVGLLAYKK